MRTLILLLLLATPVQAQTVQQADIAMSVAFDSIMGAEFTIQYGLAEDSQSYEYTYLLALQDYANKGGPGTDPDIDALLAQADLAISYYNIVTPGMLQDLSTAQAHYDIAEIHYGNADYAAAIDQANLANTKALTIQSLFSSRHDYADPFDTIDGLLGTVIFMVDMLPSGYY